jgi:hypothetical protein
MIFIGWQKAGWLDQLLPVDVNTIPIGTFRRQLALGSGNVPDR